MKSKSRLTASSRHLARSHSASWTLRKLDSLCASRGRPYLASLGSFPASVIREFATRKELSTISLALTSFPMMISLSAQRISMFA